MKLAVVVSGFPRRSETFMLGELLALEASGALAVVFATKAGETGPAQPGTERLAKYVEFLPSGSIEEQARAVRKLDATSSPWATASRWYGLSQASRMVRWMTSRPTRTATMYVIRQAMAQPAEPL